MDTVPSFLLPSPHPMLGCLESPARAGGGGGERLRDMTINHLTHHLRGRYARQIVDGWTDGEWDRYRRRETVKERELVSFTHTIRKCARTHAVVRSLHGVINEVNAELGRLLSLSLCGWVFALRLLGTKCFLAVPWTSLCFWSRCLFYSNSLVHQSLLDGTHLVSRRICQDRNHRCGVATLLKAAFRWMWWQKLHPQPPSLHRSQPLLPPRLQPMDPRQPMTLKLGSEWWGSWIRARSAARWISGSRLMCPMSRTRRGATRSASIQQAQDTRTSPTPTPTPTTWGPSDTTPSTPCLTLTSTGRLQRLSGRSWPDHRCRSCTMNSIK